MQGAGPGDGPALWNGRGNVGGAHKSTKGGPSGWGAGRWKRRGRTGRCERKPRGCAAAGAGALAESVHLTGTHTSRGTAHGTGQRGHGKNKVKARAQMWRGAAMRCCQSVEWSGVIRMGAGKKGASMWASSRRPRAACCCCYQRGCEHEGRRAGWGQGHMGASGGAGTACSDEH